MEHYTQTPKVAEGETVIQRIDDESDRVWRVSVVFQARTHEDDDVRYRMSMIRSQEIRRLLLEEEEEEVHVFDI